MHSISMAIRTLSHRSMVYSGSGFNNGLNNNNQAVRGNNNLAGTRRNQTQHLTQAQSDARLSQALRTTQGIQMQLSNQGVGYSTTSHSRAGGHVKTAINHMSTALAIR